MEAKVPSIMFRRTVQSCLLITILIVIVSKNEGCDETLPNVYAAVNASAMFTFQINIRQSAYVDFDVRHTIDGLLLSGRILGGHTPAFYPLSRRIKHYENSTSENITFTLTDVQSTDQGEYRFNIRHVIFFSGRQTLCSTLYVTGRLTKPFLSPIPEVSLGGSVEMSCSNSSSTTVPAGLQIVYTWERDDEPISSGGRYIVAGQALTILYVTREDASADFICIARENSGIRSESSPARIPVKCSPDAPGGISVDAVSDSSVSLSWSLGYNGGEEQTVRLEYKTISSGWQPLVNITDDNFTAFTITGLTEDTVYLLRMSTGNSYGWNAISTYEMVKTERNSAPVIVASTVVPVLFVVIVSFVCILYWKRSWVSGICIKRRNETAGEHVESDAPNYQDLFTVQPQTQDYDDLQMTAQGTTTSSSDNEQGPVYLNVQL